MPYKGEKKERGQALTELAMVLPVLLFLFATIFDLGRFLILSSYTDSAADTAARYYEYQGGATAAQLEDEVRTAYPTLTADSVSVELGEAVTDDRWIDQKFMSYSGTELPARSSETQQVRRTITVSYTDGWLTPIAAAASAFTSGDAQFTITVDKTAVVDKTIEVW